MEFDYLKSTLNLTAGNLSRHITAAGRHALAVEMSALRALLERHGRSG